MNEILNNLMVFIENHQEIAYIILFFGAMGEAFFPISLFIYGEVFFLAGSILAGYGILDIYIVAPLLIIGGLLGDNMSYLLGYKNGDKIIIYLKQHKLFGRYLNDKNFNKLDKFFKEKGGLGVLIARFSGPLARITPFMAGSFKLKYKTFLLYDIIGVVCGIGLFIYVGYVFGKDFELILNNIGKYLLSILLIFLICVIFFKIIKFYLTKNKHD